MLHWQQTSAANEYPVPKKVVDCDHKYWGDGQSNPIADPNPRLEAIIAAARRGATVRVLLDSYFDKPDDLRSNQATVDYLNALAAAKGLDLAARTGNPTGGGSTRSWF